jgi:hypothetical protein
VLNFKLLQILMIMKSSKWKNSSKFKPMIKQNSNQYYSNRRIKYANSTSKILSFSFQRWVRSISFKCGNTLQLRIEKNYFSKLLLPSIHLSHPKTKWTESVLFVHIDNGRLQSRKGEGTHARGILNCIRH